MDNTEFEKMLHCSKWTSGINLRYHQTCEWRWGVSDKGIRIAVGVLSVVGFWAGLRGIEYSGCAEAIALLSMITAVALNVVPTGEREKYHAEQFHRWSDLRKAAEGLDSRYVIEGTKLGPGMRDRLQEIIETEHSLHSGEPAPWPKLLLKCEEDENQSMYGVRTTAEARSLHKIPIDCPTVSSVAEVAAD